MKKHIVEVRNIRRAVNRNYAVMKRAKPGFDDMDIKDRVTELSKRSLFVMPYKHSNEYTLEKYEQNDILSEWYIKWAINDELKSNKKDGSKATAKELCYLVLASVLHERSVEEKAEEEKAEEEEQYRAQALHDADRNHFNMKWLRSYADNYDDKHEFAISAIQHDNDYALEMTISEMDAGDFLGTNLFFESCMEKIIRNITPSMKCLRYIVEEHKVHVDIRLHTICDTALSLACYLGQYPEYVEYLLEHGADVRAKGGHVNGDRKQEGCLELAIRSKEDAQPMRTYLSQAEYAEYKARMGKYDKIIALLNEAAKNTPNNKNHEN